MLLVAVLVAFSIVALTGFFGFRDGAYRRPGLVIGAVLVVAAIALFLSGRVR